jgi:hypothetical protein
MMIFTFLFQLEVLSESISKLQIISLSTLSKMKSIFPDNQPPGGIGKLISSAAILQRSCYLKTVSLKCLIQLLTIHIKVAGLKEKMCLKVCSLHFTMNIELQIKIY